MATGFVLITTQAGQEIAVRDAVGKLSLIQNSEPTRPRLISYAFFCSIKKNTNTHDLRYCTNVGAHTHVRTRKEYD